MQAERAWTSVLHYDIGIDPEQFLHLSETQYGLQQTMHSFLGADEILQRLIQSAAEKASRNKALV